MKKITFLMAAFIFGTLCLTAEVVLPTASLLVKYDFNGLTASSTTVPDLSGNSKTGDIIGTFDPATSLFPNAFYCANVSSATDRHIKTTMNATLDQLTVAFWYYHISGTGTNNTIWSPAYALAGTPKIEIASGVFRSGMKKVAAAQWAVTDPDYTPATIANKWIHIAATYDLDGTGMRLYINGIKEQEIAITELKETYTNKIFINTLMSIGTWYNSTPPAEPTSIRDTEGYVDNFQMYSTVLTDEQIASLAETNPNNVTTVISKYDNSKNVKIFRANDQMIHIEGFTASSYSISNMAGQVYQEGICINNSIKVSGINKGLHIVKLINSENEIVIKKLIL
jgi:hypothetical protein